MTAGLYACIDVVCSALANTSKHSSLARLVSWVPPFRSKMLSRWFLLVKGFSAQYSTEIWQVQEAACSIGMPMH